MSTKVNFCNIALAGAFLSLVLSSHASGPEVGLNLLNDPDFCGQPPTFQNTDGPGAAGWTYSPGYDYFSDPGYLVSQSMATGNLYYYDIDFNLGATTAQGGVDFAVDWDGTFIQYQMLPASSSWTSYSFQVVADGPASDFGLVGNTAFWSSLDNLNVSWTGDIDPPVPDSPIAFGWEALLLLGLCGAGGFYSRRCAGGNPVCSG